MKRIKSLILNNCGAVPPLDISSFQNLNLIIGENGTGKTFVLKAMYAAVRAAEDYKRGNDSRAFPEILSERLRWTYQVDKIGDIVNRNSDSALEFDMFVDILMKNSLIPLTKEIQFSFNKSTRVKVSNAQYNGKESIGNSIFIPAKEIISLINVILKSRDFDKSFGYDDTYYELAKALNITSLSNGQKYGDVCAKIAKIMGGKVEFDSKTQSWQYIKNGKKLSINITSEGIKKLAIISRLLESGYVTENSIIFIDEIESALHPKAISDLLDIIEFIAYDLGLQVFISSHSYFVIKKMYLIALKRKQPLPCISLTSNVAKYYDMSNGMPDNSIIDESIRLYEEEVSGVLW